MDQAKNVIVIKRSMGHGYAGIDNELYTDPKTGMFFSDAKTGLAEIIAAVKALGHQLTYGGNRRACRPPSWAGG